MKECPYCAELIQDAAARCPYCRSDVTGPARAPRQPARPPRGSNIGVIVAAVGAVLLMVVVVSLLMPTLGTPLEVSRRTQCKNNLKQIGLALHNYHDVYKSFPPAFVADEDGTPLYSWRVLILPFIEQESLYEQFDKSKPWDDPVNQFALHRMPAVFGCPSDTDRPGTTTNYAAVFGERCVFTGATGVPMREITDGTSNTLLVGEVTGANIPWTAPTDVEIAAHPALGDPQGFASRHEGGLWFLLGDGSVVFIRPDIDPATLARLYERNDGQPVAPPF